MTGEGLRNGDGYEHAGGYVSSLKPWTPREIVVLATIAAVNLAGNWLLDDFLGRGPGRHAFNLLVGLLLAAVCLWQILRAGRLPADEHVPNPRSLLCPERIDDNAKARRRRARIWAVLILVASLAMVAFSIRGLVDAGGGQ